MRAASAACMRTSFKVGPTFPLDCSRCCRGRIAENGGRPRWWREPSAIVSRPWSRRRQRCPESMAECAGHCEPLPARGGGSRAVANGVGLAHNPEIAGSNPAPVTRSEARRVCLPGLWMSIANGFVNGGPVRHRGPRSDGRDPATVQVAVPGCSRAPQITFLPTPVLASRIGPSSWDRPAWRPLPASPPGPTTRRARWRTSCASAAGWASRRSLARCTATCAAATLAPPSCCGSRLRWASAVQPGALSINRAPDVPLTRATAAGQAYLERLARLTRASAANADILPGGDHRPAGL